MKAQLSAALLALLLAAPCAASVYSAAEIKEMFQRSVDTDDIRLRFELRRKIAEADPNSAYGIVCTASILDLTRTSTPEEQIDLYNRAIELDPTLALAYYNRANAYRKLRQNEDALDGYVKAIILGYKKSIAYLGLGNAQQALGQNEAALESFNKAVAINPNEFYSYNNRGTLYSTLEKYDKAMADYNTALKINPAYPEVYINRAKVYAIRKNYRKALADYLTAEKLSPDQPEVYIQRAMFYLALKKPKKAVADSEKALSITPGDPRPLSTLAVAALYSGDYDKAEDAYKRYTKRFPREAGGYSELATVYIKKKRKDLAIEAMEKAVELEPKRADLRKKLEKLQAR